MRMLRIADAAEKVCKVVAVPAWWAGWARATRQAVGRAIQSHMMDDEIRELAAKLDRDRREAADAMTFEQRGWAGLGMYDLIAESVLTGIRLEHPDATEEEIHERFLDRMRELREGDTAQ